VRTEERLTDSTAGFAEGGTVHGAALARDRYGATCNCEVPMNGGMNGGSVMKLPSVPV
jgi:hypothetical protein